MEGRENAALESERQNAFARVSEIYNSLVERIKGSSVAGVLFVASVALTTEACGGAFTYQGMHLGGVDTGIELPTSVGGVQSIDVSVTGEPGIKGGKPAGSLSISLSPRGRGEKKPSSEPLMKKIKRLGKGDGMNSNN